jgi:hypothetical protein
MTFFRYKFYNLDKLFKVNLRRQVGMGRENIWENFGLGLDILWTKEEIDSLRRLYPFHSNRHLSIFFNKSPVAIRHKANRLGIMKDKESLRKINSESLRKYTLDESYFKHIDTPDKAYILGFLLGDGNIDKKYFRLSVHIHQRDEEVLYYIKECLKSNVPMKKETNRDMVSLRMSSYTLINDLAKWNMVPKKAHILELPDIKEDLNSHLIRGLFDADGCISRFLAKNKYGFRDVITYRCNIRGNGKALQKVSNIVCEEIGIFQKIHKYDGTSIYQLGGRHIISRFAHWLYKDASFYLTRKHNKFVELGLL